MRHGRQKDDVSKMGSTMYTSRSVNKASYGLDIFAALKGGIDDLAAKAMKK